MKTLIIGDLHIDRNEKHNQYIDELIDWVCGFYADRVIQLGDFFDKNTNSSYQSQKLAKSIIRRLSTNFSETFILVGNHGLTNSNNREIHSLEVFDGYYENVIIVNEPLIVSDSLLVPWICSNEEFDNVVDMSKDVEYVFGHFEFSKFRMNQSYTMKHGFTHKAFKHNKRVFSGHYHSEQEKDNVLYVGTPIALDFTNKNEFEHGIFILNHDTDELTGYGYDERKIWFVEGTIEQINEMELTNDCSVKVIVSEDDTDVAVTELSEKMDGINITFEFPRKEIKNEDVNIENISDIDTIVKECLSGIEVDGIDNDLLLKIWGNVSENV